MYFFISVSLVYNNISIVSGEPGPNNRNSKGSFRLDHKQDSFSG